MKAIIIFIILLLALGLRLYSVATVTSDHYILKKDAADYDSISLNLLSGRGFTLNANDFNAKPTTSRPPGYPFFLSVIYSVFGHNLLAVWIIQSCIWALTCLVIFLIGDKLFNFSTGAAASFIAGIYPAFIHYQYYGGPAFILTETLFTFLLTLSMFSLIVYLKNRSYSRVIIAGFLFGLSALTHATIFLFPFCLIFWFYLTKDKTSNWIKYFLVFCACFLFTVAPWSVRNYLVTGKFVPITAKAGESFWGGNNLWAKGGFALSSTLHFPDYNIREFSGLNEVDADKLKFKKGIEFLRNNPKKMPFLFLKKVLVHWSPINESKRLNYSYFIIGALAFFGMWELFSKNRLADISLFLCLFVYSTLIAVIFAGDPRYRFPLEPYLIILASVFSVEKARYGVMVIKGKN